MGGEGFVCYCRRRRGGGIVVGVGTRARAGAVVSAGSGVVGARHFETLA